VGEKQKVGITKSEHHILNLGAGVQSTTLFLLIREGVIKLPESTVAVFADTQEEPAAVYKHLEWLKSLEWPTILVRTAGKLGDDLVHGRNTTGGRFAAIPAFTTDGASEGMTRRQCTKEYKTEVIGKTIRREVVGLAHGRAIDRQTEVHQYIGISRDEARRSVGVKANIESRRGWLAHFPLMDLGWTRADCLRWLSDKVPHQVPRSACVFCPFHSDEEWLRIKRDDPAGWARAVEVDTALRTTGSVANRDMRQTMYLHRRRIPLVEVNLNENQHSFGFTMECEGMCGV
jgi:hypothetical protein